MGVPVHDELETPMLYRLSQAAWRKQAGLG